MLSKDEVLKRNNVKIIGNGTKTLLLAHGFGCDQNMWRFITPELENHFRIVLFDYVGSGHSEVTEYDKRRYSTLEGYAEDIIEICQALQLSDAIFIGHSVSSIIGSLASIKMPNAFSNLIMVCPSPCFLNFPPDYQGGFEKQDLQELLNLMDKNYIGWANYLAPLVMGSSHSNELIEELSTSFCSTDPIIAKNFAKATFLSDYRHILKEIKPPTLIFQSQNDSLAAPEIGKFINQQIIDSELQIIDADGHCLHMTHPEKITESIFQYVNK
jgi:sigma-B regulation protein RsbQ